MTFKPYPNYQPSTIEGLGHLPDHWRHARVRFVAETRKGKNPNHLHESQITADQVPYLSMEYLRGSLDNLKWLTPTDQTLMASVGDVLLLWDGSNAGEFIKARAGAVSSTTALLKSEKLDLRYFYFGCKTIEQQIRRQTVGMGIPHVNGDHLKDSRFPLPPKHEQVIIATFLDRENAKIDALISKQEKLIELLKEKRQAVIVLAVTKGLDPSVPMKASGVEWLGGVPEHWALTKAKFVSDVFVPQRNKPELNETDGYPWVTMENMRENEIGETQFRVSSTALAEAGSKVLVAGSVIASCVGSFGVASINLDPVVINQQLQAYIPKTINAHFLRFVISISTAYFELIGTAATLVYVNQTGFANLPVPVPPVDEQIKILSYLEETCTKIDSLIGKALEAIALQKEHRTALISAAVTGKIDVRDAVVEKKAA